MADSRAPLVVAYGHMFRHLDVEKEVLGRSGITLVDANTLSDAQLWDLDIDGILLGAFKRLDRERLASLRQCRGVVRYGMGVDNIDLPAAAEAGMAICNVPDYCLEEVAVHVLGCALALMRGLSYWDRAVRSGTWRGATPPTMRRPSTCVLGIIGFGQIGRLLEQRARHVFGAVRFFDPWYAAGAGDTLGPTTSSVATLETLLEQADVVSVHVPLTPATVDLLDDTALRRMKRGAFVINASRGGIVNVAALLRAISDGHLGGAALDTFEQEPVRADDELLAEPRILLTPHIAWKSQEAEIELQRRAAEEMERLLTGRPLTAQITSA